jgi:hypothetical protein
MVSLSHVYTAVAPFNLITCGTDFHPSHFELSTEHFNRVTHRPAIRNYASTLACRKEKTFQTLTLINNQTVLWLEAKKKKLHEGTMLIDG